MVQVEVAHPCDHPDVLQYRYSKGICPQAYKVSRPSFCTLLGCTTLLLKPPTVLTPLQCPAAGCSANASAPGVTQGGRIPQQGLLRLPPELPAEQGPC